VIQSVQPALPTARAYYTAASNTQLLSNSLRTIATANCQRSQSTGPIAAEKNTRPHQPRAGTFAFVRTNISKLGCDLVCFQGEIRASRITEFRSVIERLAQTPKSKSTLGTCLTTPGDEAEVVEKLLEIARYHYPES
jgi:hypothetical protein